MTLEADIQGSSGALTGSEVSQPKFEYTGLLITSKTSQYLLFLDTETYKQHLFTASFFIIVISSARLLYTFIFCESYPNLPWQISGFMLFLNVILFYAWGKEYLSLYVGLDKIDLDKI